MKTESYKRLLAKRWNLRSIKEKRITNQLIYLRKLQLDGEHYATLESRLDKEEKLRDSGELTPQAKAKL